MVNLNRFLFRNRSPLTIVELVIGISSVIGGVYVASPILQYSTLINGASPLVQTLGSPIALIIFGTLLAISGILMIFGISLRKYRIRSSALFLNICLRSYGIIGSFLVQGLLPLTWLAPLTVLIIAVICYIVVRGMIVTGRTE